MHTYSNMLFAQEYSDLYWFLEWLEHHQWEIKRLTLDGWNWTSEVRSSKSLKCRTQFHPFPVHDRRHQQLKWIQTSRKSVGDFESRRRCDGVPLFVDPPAHPAPTVIEERPLAPHSPLWVGKWMAPSKEGPPRHLGPPKKCYCLVVH